MRTIKFRGKRKDNGEWVYGSLLQCDRYTDIWYQDNECFRNRVEVEPETVGQFVGICDKNGKEIYEGDIVHGPIVFLKEQLYHEGAIVWGNCGSTTSGFNIKISHLIECYVSIDAKKLTNMEVIGNIHDNPELIEKGEISYVL